MLKIILAGRTQSGKTTLADYLKDNLSLQVLKTHTTRPKRYPEESSYHFHTEEEAELVSEKFLLTTGLDRYERWTTKPQFLKADLAILDGRGIKDAITCWHEAGHKVLLLYVDVKNEKRRLMAAAGAKSIAEANARRSCFDYRDACENAAFTRLELRIQTLLEREGWTGATQIKNPHAAETEPDYVIWFSNNYRGTDELSSIAKQVWGLSRMTANKTPIIRNREEETESAWATLCELGGVDPEKIEELRFHITQVEHWP